MPRHERNKTNIIFNEKAGLIPWYILFAPFLPLINIYRLNMGEIGFIDITRALSIAAIATIVIFFAALKIIKSTRKAGLVTLSFIIIFYSFGYFSAGIKSIGFLQNGDFAALIFDFVLLAGLGLLINISDKSFTKTTMFLNLFLPGLFLLSISSTLTKVIQNQKLLDSNLQQENTEIMQTTKQTPDIYFIILDGHARNDTLERVFDLDGSSFTNQLKDRGFFVAEKSIANYHRTFLSVTSNLNLDYLPNVLTEKEINTNNVKTAYDHLKNNKVQRFLNARGYKRITFEPEIKNQLSSADIYYSSKLIFNEYELAVMFITPLRIFVGENKLKQQAREATLYEFDNIPKIANDPDDTFVYAHILSPHSPFVFTARGDVTDIHYDGYWDGDDYTGTRDEYWKGYRQQIQYIDKLAVEMVDRILKTEPNSIIIIQSDHGSGYNLKWRSLEKSDLPERMGVLNAIYFPDRDYSSLYKSVSLVNTFRIIFNKYFGTNYETLEDKAYFSNYDKIYESIDITQKVLN